jgi:hypothetical protein
VDESLTPEERDFLASLTEDGWPLVILGGSLDNDALARVQRQALSLVRRGLAGIYGRPDDSSHLALAEAEAVITDECEWRDGMARTWMISTTKEGNALLGAPNEW